MKITSVGGEVAYVATTLNDPIFVGNALRMTGRAGVVIPQARSLSLYDGTSLEAEGISLKMEASGEARLVGLHGDLTANTTESSLIVEASRPIPTNGILNGHTINVLHQTGKAHTSGYRIADISQLTVPLHPNSDMSAVALAKVEIRNPKFIYRIDLAGVPRFAQYCMKVAGLNEENVLEVESDRENIVGNNSPYLIGRKIYFPRSGFISTIASTTAYGYRAYHNRTWFLKDAPPAGAVRVGDPMIIYAIQPGDRVLIPSFFACRQSMDAKSFAIQSSGNATLELPGGAAEGGATPEGIGIETTPRGVRLQIAPGTYQLDAAMVPRESTRGNRDRLYFWRTKGGLEVDFIVHGEDTFVAIEVKNSRRVSTRDTRPLREFQADYPEAQTCLLYRGSERIYVGDTLCIPCDTYPPDAECFWRNCCNVMRCSVCAQY